MTTYVVRRMGRQSPSMARIGGQIVRAFPRMAEISDDEAADLRARGFRVTESKAVPEPPPPPEPDYSAMTVDELKGLAADRGVEVPSKAKKADLISLLGG